MSHALNPVSPLAAIGMIKKGEIPESGKIKLNMTEEQFMRQLAESKKSANRSFLSDDKPRYEPPKVKLAKEISDNENLLKVLNCINNNNDEREEIQEQRDYLRDSFARNDDNGIFDISLTNSHRNGDIETPKFQLRPNYQDEYEPRDRGHALQRRDAQKRNTEMLQEQERIQREIADSQRRQLEFQREMFERQRWEESQRQMSYNQSFNGYNLAPSDKQFQSLTLSQPQPYAQLSRPNKLEVSDPSASTLSFQSSVPQQALDPIESVLSASVMNTYQSRSIIVLFYQIIKGYLDNIGLSIRRFLMSLGTDIDRERELVKMASHEHLDQYTKQHVQSQVGKNDAKNICIFLVVLALGIYLLAKMVLKA